MGGVIHVASVIGTLLAALGVVLGTIALGWILYASGLTGAPAAVGLLVPGIGLFMVGVFTFGYGTARSTRW